MFRVGDKIVCIDNSCFNGKFINIGDIYIIKNIIQKGITLELKEIVNMTSFIYFPKSSFISMMENRRRKVKRILCSNQETS